MSNVTQILSRIERGDSGASEQLLPLVYEELRKLASARLAQEKPGQTLQATALVHEAYLRLVGSEGQSPAWDNRGHFFAAAAEAMRRIVIENARRKKRFRHGGTLKQVDVDLADLPVHMKTDELLALNEALESLASEAPVKAQLITLRYFGGLTIEQAADVLGISRVTAFRYWTYARAWLHQRMQADDAAK